MAQLAISKRSRRRRSREQWMRLVASHGESGLSVGSYCEREHVSAASFYRWRALLGSELTRVPGAATAPRPKAREAQFVVLGMMNPLPLATGGDSARRCGEALELRLELGAGIVLTVSRG